MNCDDEVEEVNCGDGEVEEVNCDDEVEEVNCDGGEVEEEVDKLFQYN